MTGSSSSDYSINYVRNWAGGYDVDRCIICTSTTFPTGVGFHLNVIENSLTFTNQNFAWNATPKKNLATGFAAFSTESSLSL